MTPVDQRVYSSRARDDGHNGLGISGDCMRAALASILDLDYSDVPHVCHYLAGYDVDADPLADEHGALWWRRLRRWLRDRGLDILATDMVCIVDPPRPPLCTIVDGVHHPYEGWVIASGPSHRGPWNHAAVGWHHPDGYVDIVHDPNPSRAGLSAVVRVEVVCDPYDPPPPP